MGKFEDKVGATLFSRESLQKSCVQPCTWWKWDKNLCTTLYYTGFCIILLFWPICAIFSHLCHLCLASVPSVLSVPICACLCHLGRPLWSCCFYRTSMRIPRGATWPSWLMLCSIILNRHFAHLWFSLSSAEWQTQWLWISGLKQSEFKTPGWQFQRINRLDHESLNSKTADIIELNDLMCINSAVFIHIKYGILIW